MGSKWFSKLGIALAGIAMAVGVGVGLCNKADYKRASAADVLYKDIAFNSTNNKKEISNYTSTWTNVTNSFTWTFVNFNNNNNGWTYVKCGRSGSASTGSIKTQQVTAAISKVRLVIGAITADGVTSITLYSGASAGAKTTNLGTFDKSTGNKDIAIASPTANLYYTIEAVCVAKSNGSLRVDNVVLYQHEDDDQTINNSASYSASIREDGSISLETNAASASWSITSGDTYGSFDDDSALTSATGKMVTLYGRKANGGETRTVSISATASGYKAATATITLNAKPAGTYYDITFNGGANLSLPNDAETNVISGSDILWQLETTAKHKFPAKVNVSVVGTYTSWDYSDGLLEIEGVGSNITITTSAVDASIASLVLNGYQSKFDVNEQFNSNGLVVNGTYDDDINPHTSEVLSSSLYDVDSSEYDATVAGDYIISVSLKADDSIYEMYEVNVSDMALGGTYNIISNATVYDGNVTPETFISKTDNSSAFTAAVNNVRFFCNPGSGDIGDTGDIVLSSNGAYLTLSVHNTYLITRVETSASAKGSSKITLSVGDVSIANIVNTARTEVVAHPFASSVTISTNSWTYLEYINVVVVKKDNTTGLANAFGRAFNDLTHSECAAMEGISDETWTKVNGKYNLAIAANASLESTLATAESNKTGDDLGQAMFRYDLIKTKYDKSDFLGRFAVGGINYSARGYGTPSDIANESNSYLITAVIIALSLSALLIVGGYFFIKRRHQ